MKSVEQGQSAENSAIQSLLHAASVDPDTIYHFLTPALAEALSQAKGINEPNGEILDLAEKMLKNDPDVARNVNFIFSLVQTGDDKDGEINTGLELLKAVGKLIAVETAKIRDETN